MPSKVLIALVCGITLLCFASPQDETPAAPKKKKAAKSSKSTSKATAKSSPTAAKAGVKTAAARPAVAKPAATVPAVAVKTTSAAYRSSLVRTAAYSRTTKPVLIKGGPWREPTFAASADGDWIEGEDP